MLQVIKEKPQAQDQPQEQTSPKASVTLQDLQLLFTHFQQSNLEEAQEAHTLVFLQSHASALGCHGLLRSSEISPLQVKAVQIKALPDRDES